MKDIIDRLIDLHHQATKERSHNYTGTCIKEAIEEIVRLRTIIKEMSKNL
jgi:hypothetical protein